MKTIVLYGSTTGNNELIAGIINETLIKMGFEVVLKNVATANSSELTDYDLIVIGSSTWGDGELQDDMVEFSREMKNINLLGKKATAFGCGDDSWPNFCTAPDILDRQLINCGANIVAKPLKVNGSATDSEDTIKQWAKELAMSI